MRFVPQEFGVDFLSVLSVTCILIWFSLEIIVDDICRTGKRGITFYIPCTGFKRLPKQKESLHHYIKEFGRFHNLVWPVVYISADVWSCHEKVCSSRVICAVRPNNGNKRDKLFTKHPFVIFKHSDVKDYCISFSEFRPISWGYFWSNFENARSDWPRPNCS